MHRFGFILAALLLSSQASAATIFKCVDEAGKVTFTKSANCPRNSGLDDVISAHNAAPSGSSAPVQMATPTAQQYAPRPSGANKGVVVVGGSSRQVECNTGLSDQDLRTAKLRGEVVPGMSRKDVESIHGKASDDTNVRGAGVNTYFKDKYVRATSVAFDRHGCVRGGYQSTHNP